MGIVALVSGIMAVPSLLRWIVGIALIVMGILPIAGEKQF